MWTRHGTDVTDRLPSIRDAVAQLPSGATLDGELVALRASHDRGVVQDWRALGGLWFGGQIDPAANICFVCFDALHDGRTSIEPLAWTERRARLESLLQDGAEPLAITPVHPATIEEHRRVVSLGFEGSVWKHRQAIYRRGSRCHRWRKLKSRVEAEVTVHGMTHDRRTGVADGVLFQETGRAGLQRAWLGAAGLKERIEGVGGPLHGRIVFSRRDFDGTAREARLLTVAGTEAPAGMDVAAVGRRATATRD